jgi:hypothetical protein
MIKIIIIIIASLTVLTAAGIIIFRFINRRPDFSAYTHLESPRISIMSSQKMLEITVRGRPESVLPQAFGILYQTYFSLPGVNKGGPPPAARLRCAIPEDYAQSTASPDEFTATIGLPLPESVTAVPPSGGPMQPTLAVWEYDEVAEILHHGDYDREPPTINKLLEFIHTQSYAATGVHEEEYLYGPGAPGATPEHYLTIIRYPVKKQ